MEIVNEITRNIVKNAQDKESIRSLASRIGFAYSAVYKWVLILEHYGVIHLIKKGNRNIITIQKNEIYTQFKKLDEAISTVEKDTQFWKFIKTIPLHIRFVQGTATAIWTKGSFITGDFYDRVYFLEVKKEDVPSLKKQLERKGQ